MKDFRFFLVSAASVAALSACQKDEGMKSYNAGIEKYGAVLKQGLNESNSNDAMLLSAILKVIVRTHPEAKSGVTSQKTLDELRKMSLERKATLEKVFEEKKKPIVEDMVDLDEMIRPLLKKKRKPVGFSHELHFMPGMCLGIDSTSEFDDDKPVIDKFVIKKVKRVGEEQVLLEQVFKGSMDDIGNATEALKRENHTEPEYKNLVSDDGFPIDCKTADKIVDKYHSMLKEAVSSEGLRTEMRNINTILSSDLM